MIKHGTDSINRRSATESRSWRYARSQRPVPTQGKISDYSAGYIIDFLHEIGFSGSLQLRLNERKKKLWFHRGEIFRIQSNLVPELFGQLLVDKKWITETDLQTCLRLQRELFQVTKTQRPIGLYVEEICGIKEEERHQIAYFQRVLSLLQAMAWEGGDFEYAPHELRSQERLEPTYDQLLRSIESLLDLNPSPLGPLFKVITPWAPRATSVELSEAPLWTILAGCRISQVSGILSIRKQNKLFEIVLKGGIPMIFYEGSFGQPRQIVLIRNASEEHESAFLKNLFQLFSFLSGVVHFKPIPTPNAISDDVLPEEESREEKSRTAVANSQMMSPSEKKMTGPTELIKELWSRIFSS